MLSHNPLRTGYLSNMAVRIDRNVTVHEVEAAVKKELEGPGKLLGYRALHEKIRQVYDLNVPRDLVYAVMYNVDADALEGAMKQVIFRVLSHGEFWL